MTDRRNFRSSYLEKVGIKGVEEKKSIEILLKESTLDVNKLSQFCLRFVVPPMYRNYVWKILLGILPPHQASHDMVMAQRAQQYEDVREALLAMRRINEETPLPETHLKIYLVEERVLLYDEIKLMADTKNRNFLSIASAMCCFNHDAVDTYWLTKKFYDLTEKYEDSIPLMLKRVEYYVQKEDPDRTLHGHLVALGAFTALPITEWFSTAFSGVLDDTCLERIWDKILGGSCKILVYVAVAILLTVQRPLLSMRSADSVVAYLAHIPEDNGQNIVSKAIELWQKHGSLLKPSSGSSAGASKGASPAGIHHQKGASPAGIHHHHHKRVSPSGVHHHHHHRGNSPGYHHHATHSAQTPSNTANRPPS